MNHLQPLSEGQHLLLITPAEGCLTLKYRRLHNELYDSYSTRYEHPQGFAATGACEARDAFGEPLGRCIYDSFLDLVQTYGSDTNE